MFGVHRQRVSLWLGEEVVTNTGSGISYHPDSRVKIPKEEHAALIVDPPADELSPLEIGLHALEFVEAYENGGIKRYAEGVGYAQPSISAYRQAASVFKKVLDVEYNKKVNVLDRKSKLLEKTNHLREIHAANPDCWKILVDLLLSRDETAQPRA